MKLVVQRISLLMFKIYKSDVPKPINILFRKNNTYHSYNTRRSDNLHTPVVGQKRYTKHLAFMEFIYGIIYQVPYKLMFVTRLLNV